MPRGMGQLVELSRVTALVTQYRGRAHSGARRLCTMCCPGVRSPSVGSATTLTSPFSLQKILVQNGLTTSGRLHAHHSHQMYFALHARMATNRWVAPVEHHQLCFVAQNGSHRDWSLENIHLRDLALSQPSSDLRNPDTLEAL